MINNKDSITGISQKLTKYLLKLSQSVPAKRHTYNQKIEFYTNQLASYGGSMDLQTGGNLDAQKQQIERLIQQIRNASTDPATIAGQLGDLRERITQAKNAHENKIRELNGKLTESEIEARTIASKAIVGLTLASRNSLSDEHVRGVRTLADQLGNEVANIVSDVPQDVDLFVNAYVNYVRELLELSRTDAQNRQFYVDQANAFINDSTANAEPIADQIRDQLTEDERALLGQAEPAVPVVQAEPVVPVVQAEPVAPDALNP